MIESMLAGGCPIVISISGGKDSDAMARKLHEQYHGRNPIVLVHADLGRAELKATPAHVKLLAEELGLELGIVRHSRFDLLDGIRHRMKAKPDVPPWPSPSVRQCTSDWKRGPISKWIRNRFPCGDVVCAIGLRADESPARSKKKVAEPRKDCCSRNRNVWNWLPIHRWSESMVWEQLAGHPHHEAYDRGNCRVSCAMCVLACVGDLRNGADQDPELFRDYCDIEIESGFSFRQNFWLGTVAPELLREEQKPFYVGKNLPLPSKRLLIPQTKPCHT